MFRFLTSRRLTLAFWVLVSGCSNYALPHHAYAPLLERANQVDARVGLGVNAGAGTPEMTVEGQIAGSPVDAFVIAGGVTASVIPGDQASNHVDGELALGAYLTGEPNLRAEVLGGCAGGYGTGFFFGEEGDADLRGLYARPFVQGTLAGVTQDRMFTVGGGLRVATTLVDMDVQDVAPVVVGPSYQTSGFKQSVHLDPFLTVRIGGELARFEGGFGASVSFGDRVVGSAVNVWLSLGLRLRFDLEPE